jgi:hypothetical protein
MKPLALTVLLAIVQASPPVPRQASDNPAGARPKIERNAQKAENPSADLPSGGEPMGSASANRNAGEQANKDAHHDIAASEPRPVMITHPRRDLADWAYWGFSLLLAVVGALQVWLLCRTLGWIRRQATQMKRQAGFMRLQWRTMTGQLKEMEKSREIETKTLILQYRPKVTVRFATAYEFNIPDLGEPARGKVQLTVVNAGGSAAHICGGTIAMWSAMARTHPASGIEIKRGEEVPIGNFTLQPGEDALVTQTLATGATNDIPWANYHAGIRVEPPRHIYLVGTIYYTDDLGIPRRTGIHRTYEPSDGSFTPNRDSEREYTD